MYGVPKGSRTPVTAVKGRCPRPLDDGDLGVLIYGGARRDRTADLYNAIVALSQLSYSPGKARHVTELPSWCQSRFQPAGIGSAKAETSLILSLEGRMVATL